MICDGNSFVCWRYENLNFPGKHVRRCFQFSPRPSLSHGCPLQQTLVFRKIISCAESLLNLTEFSEGLAPLAPLKDLNQLSFTNIRCDADKRGMNQKRKHVYGKTEKGDENQRPRTFDGNNRSKSPDQEEIIALLRRIQLSISKGDSQGTEKEVLLHTRISPQLNQF